MQTSTLDLGATGTSAPFGSSESSAIGSVQVSFTGTPTGTFDLLATNEEQTQLPPGQAPTYVTLVTGIAPSAGALPAGGPGSFTYEIVNKAYARYMLKYNKTSGAGTAYISPVFARSR